MRCGRAGRGHATRGRHDLARRGVRRGAACPRVLLARDLCAAAALPLPLRPAPAADGWILVRSVLQRAGDARRRDWGKRRGSGINRRCERGGRSAGGAGLRVGAAAARAGGGRGRAGPIPGVAARPQILVAPAHIAVLNGPNLNLLGKRERARALGVELSWRQTNHEGELIEAIQQLSGKADGAVVNAAAFTHTSLAVRDALLAVRVPFVEVHLSNIFAREPERRRSLLADAAVGVVAGFGAESYRLGLEGLVGYLQSRRGR